jgi:hypothetical protein
VGAAVVGDSVTTDSKRVVGLLVKGAADGAKLVGAIVGANVVGFAVGRPTSQLVAPAADVVRPDGQ